MMSDYELDLDSDDEEDIHDMEKFRAMLDDERSSNVSVSNPSMSTGFSSKYEEYSKIETVLALNKMCDEKLRRLEKVLQARLNDCRQKLSELQGMEKDERYDKIEKFSYVNCGKPYFKDKSNFPAPDNEDTILMAKSGMYDFSNIVSVPGWTVKDKSQFSSLIHKMSKDIRKSELNSQIAALKREYKSNQINMKLKKNIVKDDKNIEKKIAMLRKEIDKVNKLSLKELALPLNEEYDWDAVANKLNHRHSAQEYRSLWKLFLHPSINKNIWTRNEHMKLQKIAYDEKLQDWDKIAKTLNNGRTKYQCFVYYRTNMSNTFTGRKWTMEEEEYLKRLIEYYKEDNYIPWGKVAASMENRTKIQVYNKYLRMLEVRKGRFLPEEDAVILTCSENFGPNFKKMVKYLPGRSVTQCRNRYMVLVKTRISTVWSAEEDKKLVQLMASQDSCTNYSNIAPFFPGKDRVNIRARYLTLAKWMRRNPNVDISKAPRRGARRLGHGQSSDNLNKAIENLKNKIQSELVDKRSKKLTKDSPEYAIEDAIVALLVTEHSKLGEAKKIDIENEDSIPSDDETEHYTEKCNVTNLHKILILLRAKLNKDKFMKSDYSKKYRNLIDAETGPKTYTVKVKSYSKINSEEHIKINEAPDIWGNICLGPLAYVLPPHYSTITGCSKLLSYVSSKGDQEEICNFSVLMRKNSMLKAQLFLIMERFNALFLWPMLLSNSPPDASIGFDE